VKEVKKRAESMKYEEAVHKTDSLKTNDEQKLVNSTKCDFPSNISEFSRISE
jgi:hypothetical protein